MSDTTFHTKNKTGLRPPSMWTVIFVNDDYTPMQFVAQVLMAVYHRSPEDAQQITMIIHNEGKAGVGSYTFEVASHKAEQTMMLAAAGQHPLLVYPERLG